MVMLRKVINGIFLFGYFSAAWKTAKTIPMPKPGKKKTLVSSYRPISLLPYPSKVAEKAIEIRILNFVGRKNIVIKEEFLFFKGLSTVDQLVRLTNHITEQFNKNKHTGSIIFDIEQAFDTLWHNSLMYKLIEYNFSLYLVFLINSFIRNRQMYVEYQNNKSEIQLIKAGVPQGSVLGPQLYILNINDVPRTKHVHINLFANDKGLFTSPYRIDVITNRLPNSANKLLKYCKTWKIKLNTYKIEVIIFTKRRPVIIRQSIVENTPIK